MPFVLFQILTVIAAYAFPLLPYELFVLMPWVLAYFAENPTNVVTGPRLVAFITVWGALWAGIVHTFLAFFALLGSEFKFENLQQGATEGICSALPAPTPGPWCVLLMGHIMWMMPMGWFFIYRVVAERIQFGAFLKWSGSSWQLTFYERAAFVFIWNGISGNLPYIGQIFIQGWEVFQGPGVYTDNGKLPSWYNGRGYIEFGAYTSFLIGGLYFLVKALNAQKPMVPMI